MSRSSRSADHRAGVGLAVLLLGASLLVLLDTPRPGPAQSPETAPETPEVTSHESLPTFGFRVQRNEVMVRVIVRDSKGNPVSHLKQSDFRIFDNRKPQLITHFSVEPAAKETAKVPGGSTAAGSSLSAGTTAPTALARRFMALYFDDVHLQFGDLVPTRNAADRYLAQSMAPGDVAAVFTSSGQNQLDFTDDRQQLHSAVFSLRPRPLYQPVTTECPQMSTDQAYKMVDLRDPYAIQIAYEEAFECNCDPSAPAPVVQQCQARANSLADSKAMEVLQRGESQTQYALQGLERVCRRMAEVPGQRSVVVLSPGFFTGLEKLDIDRIIDQALRQNVVISTLDARGLYAAPPLGDASQDVILPVRRPDLTGNKVQIQQDALRTDADVLSQLADETGGAYFHNSNDLGDGFWRVGAFPNSYYVLAFAPDDLKPDGRLHTLKVALADNPDHFTVQARRGYFAPNKAQDAATVAKEELQQMIFSQEELHTIPMEVHTQFFKPTTGEAKLSVLTHVDIHAVPFRKADGRSVDNVTVVTAVFDRAGNYVTGEQKQIEFHLRDETLARLSQTGLNMKASLTVKSGTYLIRQVVRESEGDQLSATSSEVEIP
ncbi:MAG TPA: VWA domain-containing protein [Terriglobia bacterium]|nr:VWA domain-containing protein [Terriglobia bacterium]